MAKPLRVALIGGDEPLAQALLAELEAFALPIGEVLPLALDAQGLADSEFSLSFEGESLLCQAAAGFDWARADLVFSLSRQAGATPHIDAAVAAGRPVFALADALHEHPGARLIDPERIEPGPAGPGLWLAPDAITTLIARALRPLIAALGVERIDAFAALAVSALGQEGMRELKDQVAKLFGMAAIEPEIFPMQIAFNLVPQVGRLLADGHTGMERAVTAQLVQLLGTRASCRLTLSWAPVFHGHAVALHLAGGEGLNADNVRTRLAHAPGVVVMDERLPGGYPTPASDAAESRAVFAGRLRDAMIGADSQGVQLWLVGDNIQLEAANLAEIARAFIEKSPKSVIS